jgi:hypothetical protein
MSDVLSIGIFILIVTIGYRFPNKSGWFSLLVVNMLGPTGLTVMGTASIPLTINRVGYAICIGILIKSYLHRVSLYEVFKIGFVRYYVLFSLFIVFVSLSYMPKFTIFTYFPTMVNTLFLSFLIVDTEEKIFRLAKIYVLMACFVSVSILLEYHTQVNLSLMIERTIPGVGEFGKYAQAKSGINEILRFDEYRPGGLWRNSVNTGYLLAFLFPFTVWFASKQNSKQVSLLKWLPLIMTTYAIYLLKTRSVLLAMVASLMIISFYTLRFVHKKDYTKNILYLISFISLGVGISLIYNQETLMNVLSYLRFMQESIDNDSNIALDARYYWIAQSIELGLASPLWGYLVSPLYAYYELMHYNDLPAIFIYFLSGGILLVIVFLTMIFKVLWGTHIIITTKTRNDEMRYLLFFVFAGFFSGFVVLFSNRIEDHIPMMISFFICIYNVYFFRVKVSPKTI